MLRAALRDLQWRRKRFVIAMLGVALVFAMGLIMTGLTESFSLEVNRTLHAIDADTWLVADGASGPLTSFSPVPVGLVTDSAASPALILRQSIVAGSKIEDVVIVGAEIGRPGSVKAAKGRDVAGSGEVVVDTDFSLARLGESFSVGTQTFTVVGTVSGQRLYAGVPMMYMTLRDAQTMSLQGQPYASTFIYEVAPDNVPAGLKAMSTSEVRKDVLRPLDDAVSSIALVRMLLWIVAATIIGSVLYLQAMERTRDFAVFKATGTSTAAIGVGLALQAVALSLAAAALAAVLAAALAPSFPIHVEIPSSAYQLLPVVTVAVGLLANLIALRKTATVQPASAFGG